MDWQKGLGNCLVVMCVLVGFGAVQETGKFLWFQWHRACKNWSRIDCLRGQINHAMLGSDVIPLIDLAPATKRRCAECGRLCRRPYCTGCEAALLDRYLARVARESWPNVVNSFVATVVAGGFFFFLAKIDTHANIPYGAPTTYFPEFGIFAVGIVCMIMALFFLVSVAQLGYCAWQRLGYALFCRIPLLVLVEVCKMQRREERGCPPVHSAQ